jgi:hypothetical protein
MTRLLFTACALFFNIVSPGQGDTISVADLIYKLRQAHGGLQNWKKAKTVYFNHHIVFGMDSTRQWWISREMTELSTMRFYETRPYENATIVYDGNKTWSTNWKQTNPPSMLVNNHLLQQVLPFLASYPMVVISKEPDVKLPGNDSVSFLTLKLRFKQAANFDSAKYYRIFIHPVSFRMAGWEYNITHPKQLKNIGLADSIKSFGPFINKIHTYTTVDGLLFPEKYDTYNPSGKISGNHLVLDYKINGKFDEKMMNMPRDAVIDSSQRRFNIRLN